jgi:1-phosphofructokinase
VLCATVGGEVGDVLTPLLRSQTAIELVAVQQPAPSSVSMYDRRSGTRTLIARSESSPIDRHAVDKLYSLTLAHAIGRGCCVLAGNIDTGTIPPAYYGRLCADLTAVGVPIIADVHGPELAEILDSAPVQLLKVSDEDLRDDGAVGDDLHDGLIDAVNDLAERGSPRLGRDTRPGPRRRGAHGRPLVHGLAASTRRRRLAWRGRRDGRRDGRGHIRGLTGVDLLRFGAAAGAASVTRRGLASLDSELVHALIPRVHVDAADDVADALSA